MEKFIDTAFKDDSPLSTVEKIRGILKENGIETEEAWLESGVPYCYSLSLSIKGIPFSTSGKGLSRELALASAYGEMIERVQLGFLGKRATQKDGSYSMNDSQDIEMSIDVLKNGDMDIYQRLSDRLFSWNGTRLTPQDILMQYADNKEAIRATPFVSLINGEVKYIPSKMRKSMYTSNGCAAGNSFEEAIVQALSEIVERAYRLRIIKENICVPMVPNEILEKYETPYKIIQYIRAQGYKVWVKDCSLGEKFPVLCVCFVNEATGKYHTHFGAYPIFEIALTRALTETFQGRNVGSFATYDDFFYNKEEKDFLYNLSQEFTYGTAKRLPEFFFGKPAYEHSSGTGFTGTSNKELLKECIAFFKERGHEILVRSSSGLGFPTVQVIVPGYSETYIHRLSKDADDNRYLPFAVKTARDPSSATIQDMIGFIMHFSETAKFVTHPGKSGFLACAKLTANTSTEKEGFLLASTFAYINYTLGKLSEASKYAANMLKLKTGVKEELLICIKRYLDLTLKGYEPESIDELLRMFHSEKTVQQLYSYVNSNQNPFEEFVLHCDMLCSDVCPIKDTCCQKRVQGIIDTINEQTRALSLDDFQASIVKAIS